MRLSKKQADLASWIAFNALCKTSTYVETGRYKNYADNTVRSLINKGFAKTARVSILRDVYHLEADGELQQVVDDVSEWCYGDCMTFLDDHRVDYYNYQDDLLVYQSLVVDVKIGKRK